MVENKMEKLNEKELGLTGVQEGIWYDYTLPSDYKGTVKYRKVVDQDIIELYFNVNYRGNQKGSHRFNVIPKAIRPESSSSILGIVTYDYGNNYKQDIQYLTVDDDGDVYIPGMTNAITKDFVFYGMAKF